MPTTTIEPPTSIRAATLSVSELRRRCDPSRLPFTTTAELRDSPLPCDVVVVGTPIDLSRLVKIRKPVVRVRYELQEIGQPDLAHVVDDFLGWLSIPAPGCTKLGKVMAIADGDAER